MKKVKTVDVHLRVPARVHEVIVRAAVKNRRPITSEILVRLDDSIARAAP